MRKLSVEDIIAKINKGQNFEAECDDASFYIKISEYVPYICAAVHEGHQLREDLQEKIIHSEQERWYEEDPKTLDFISSFPIVIAGKDSRFEYDLNRRAETAVYEDAWGKEVWKSPLSEQQKALSLAKHANFYKVIHAIVDKLEKLFEGCVVYDMHSYNYKRHEHEVPVFNLGTENINNKKYKVVKDAFLKGLQSIDLPNIENTTEENGPFKGRGYLLEYVTTNFNHSLVLATEVKKIYCNEETGEYFSQVIDALKDEFKRVILENALMFAKKHTNLKVRNSNLLLSKALDKSIIQVDKQLYHLVKSFEVLRFVNPINIAKEKKKFIKANGNYNPTFNYKQLNVNPFLLKRKLMNIPVEEIDDVHIQAVYQDVINAYCDKVELIASIGTDKFMYNSLRYFGEPSENDIANAHFILHLNNTETKEVFDISDQKAISILKDALSNYAFDCKIKLSDKLAAKAMVVNSEKTLYMKKGAVYSENEIMSLLHHEIGVHMVTTMNANAQPIKLFSMGLPLNTQTQEGLAIMSEYYSNTLTIERLRELSLRVLAIESMLKDFDFSTTARLLMNHGLSIEEAFYLTTRVFRGGGFTKDYLYLSGLSQVSKIIESNDDFDGLMIGKTHASYLDLIDEMIDRKLVFTPPHKNPAYLVNNNENKLVDYVIQNLR